MKPENILIFNDKGKFSIKLADFGISKAFDLCTISTTVNMLENGAWVAPEVAARGHVRNFYVSFNLIQFNLIDYF